MSCTDQERLRSGWNCGTARLLSVVELEMELEVSYNKNYCVEDRAELKASAW